MNMAFLWIYEFSRLLCTTILRNKSVHYVWHKSMFNKQADPHVKSVSLESYFFEVLQRVFWYECHENSLKFIFVESAYIFICETKDMTSFA